MNTTHPPTGEDPWFPLQWLNLERGTTTLRIPAPLLRIHACGLLRVEVLCQIRENPILEGRYQSLREEQVRGRNGAQALTLLKLLISRPHRHAPKPYLMEHLGHEEQAISEGRLDDLVTKLRGLICTEQWEHLRTHLVQHVHSSAATGNGYRLAVYPLIWLDTDALAWYVEQAARLERFGEPELACTLWERVSVLSSRGDYLGDEEYADWAVGKRGEVARGRRASIHALSRLLVATAGEAGEAQALHLLSAYCSQYPLDEDALRPLMELLGKHERFGEAFALYERACALLSEEGLAPDEKTSDIAQVLRTKELKRQHIPREIVPHQEKDPQENPSLFNTQSVSLTKPSQPHAPLWNIPYQRNPYFTGREEVLERLSTCFHQKSGTPTLKQYALCGLGGIGKTHIALEYAYRYRDHYHALFWIKADTQENLSADFLSLATLLLLPEKDATDSAVTLAAIHHWLRMQAQWLMIFDNADDLSLVKTVLPTGHLGHVLLTTRAQALGKLAHRIEIATMDQEAGALLLLRRAGFIDQETSLEGASSSDGHLAQAIVLELGGLPLALDQAGAYIEETSSSLQEYLHTYKTGRHLLLNRRGGMLDDHPEPVATTWLLSFQQIERMDPVAADVLRLGAFLDPDAIPEELFAQGAVSVCPLFQAFEHDPLRLHQTFEILRKYSLVRRNPETKTFFLHRLVQANLQDCMDQSTQRLWAQYAIEALTRLFPSEVQVHCWPQCQRLLSHVQLAFSLVDQYQIDSTETATLFNQAGYYLREQAGYSEAEIFYRKSFDLRQRCLGYWHPETAQVLYNLARLYFDIGQYDLCEQLHLQALTIREQALPPLHLDLALSLNSLAFLYYIGGNKPQQSEQLYQRALPLFEQTIGLDHPKTAHCLSNQALLSASQGRYAEAEQLLVRVQDIRERILGEWHVDTARSLQNLAWLYIEQNNQDRFTQAKELLERSLSIREKLLGSEHPQTALSLYHLATLYEAENHYSEAQQLYLRAIFIRRKMMGSKNPKVLLTEQRYRSLLAKMGSEEESVQKNLDCPPF